jgi:LDH2 family malate/lactate/ureidoglycolate dehydrogenase
LKAEGGNKTSVFSEEELQKFCTLAFETFELAREDAKLFADTLVKAEMRGVSSHGIVRLPFYCARLKDGGTKTHPQMKTLIETPAVLLLDGDNGFGQVVATRAMKMAIEKARTAGICFAGVRNSCHMGMVAYYPMLALDEHMIGIVGSNSPPTMAAWGGFKSTIGNNPLAVAIPTGKGFPLVLDMAMSVASGGKVRLAAVKKEKIPLDWVLDANGRPTDRPEDFFPHGTLLPLGHKGFGLAVIIEVLSGVLTGAGILSQMGQWLTDTSIPIDTGHFFIALNIKTFCSLETFTKRVNHMIDELKRSPRMEGCTEILMPGEMESRMLERNKREGVTVSPEVLKNLNDFASRIGLAKLTA